MCVCVANCTRRSTAVGTYPTVRFFSFILTLLHAHKCRALVGRPRGACRSPAEWSFRTVVAVAVNAPSCNKKQQRLWQRQRQRQRRQQCHKTCVAVSPSCYLFLPLVVAKLWHTFQFFFFDLLPLQSSRNFSKISVKRNVTILFVLRRLCCNLNAHAAVAHSSMILC